MVVKVQDNQTPLEQVVLVAEVQVLDLMLIAQVLQEIPLLSVLLKEIMVVMEMVLNQDLFEEVAVEAVVQVLLELLQLHHRLVMVVQV